MIALHFFTWDFYIWWMALLKPIKYGLPIDPEPFNVIREPGLIRIGWLFFVLRSDIRDVAIGLRKT